MLRPHQTDNDHHKSNCIMAGRKNKINYEDIDIRYTIQSSMAPSEGYRYRQQINGVMLYFNDAKDPEKSIEIGKIEAHKLLLGEAANAGYSALAVFDAHHVILDIGETIYDFEKNDFSDAIYDHFEVPSMDLLIVYGLEILPQYRGSEIGKYAIRDLYNNFISGCGLMTIIIYPSQLETRVPGIGESDYEWYNDMGYKTMEADEEKSIYKLLGYYTSMGFKYIPEISEDLLFHTPAKINETFNKIKLD